MSHAIVKLMNSEGCDIYLEPDEVPEFLEGSIAAMVEDFEAGKKPMRITISIVTDEESDGEG